jgi:hypothetical protein
MVIRGGGIIMRVSNGDIRFTQNTYSYIGLG